MQKLLNAKTKEVKQLQQQIHGLENEKQEAEVNTVLLHKKVAKLCKYFHFIPFYDLK